MHKSGLCSHRGPPRRTREPCRRCSSCRRGRTTTRASQCRGVDRDLNGAFADEHRRLSNSEALCKPALPAAWPSGRTTRQSRDAPHPDIGKVRDLRVPRRVVGSCQNVAALFSSVSVSRTCQNEGLMPLRTGRGALMSRASCAPPMPATGADDGGREILFWEASSRWTYCGG